MSEKTDEDVENSELDSEASDPSPDGSEVEDGSSKASDSTPPKDDADEDEDAARRQPKRRSKPSSRKKGKKKSKKRAETSDEDSSEAARRRPKRSEKRDAEASGERWLCVHCAHQFRADDPDRCPSCMRKGGLEVLVEKSAKDRPWLMPALVVGAIALIGGGYAFWSNETPDAVEGDAALEPLSYSELRGHLREHNADGEHAGLLREAEHIEGLAEHATGSTPMEKTESLVSYIRARAAAGAFTQWLLEAPRESTVHDGEWAAARLQEEENAEIYPIELAAAAVSALREAGVDAMVAEIWEFPGDRVPPDPSGHMGYFGVAAYEGAVGEGDPVTFHPCPLFTSPSPPDRTRSRMPLSA